MISGIVLSCIVICNPALRVLHSPDPDSLFPPSLPSVPCHESVFHILGCLRRFFFRNSKPQRVRRKEKKDKTNKHTDQTPRDPPEPRFPRSPHQPNQTPGSRPQTPRWDCGLPGLVCVGSEDGQDGPPPKHPQW